MVADIKNKYNTTCDVNYRKKSMRYTHLTLASTGIYLIFNLFAVLLIRINLQ